MTYDFDRIIPRRGTHCVKWDAPQEEGVLPMWVADMDFRTAPAIIEALQRRVSHGIFGYTKVPAAYYEAVCSWFERRHQWTIDPSHIIYTTGVVPAVSAVIKALTEPGDHVIIQTPVYNCFFSSIRNNDCEISANALTYRDGRYTIDFDDLERRAADPRARVLLLCNPHNPSGRVWTRDELQHVADIALRHDLWIISDEIHCELTYAGHDYTPMATVSPEAVLPRLISCVSPSKAFNIAGLQIANIITANDELRRRIDRAININEVCDVNPFGIEGAMAAYNEGADWLDDLRSYLWDNYILLRERLSAEAPHCTMPPLEGTYLPWIDCRATGLTSAELNDRLLHEQKLMINPGTIYGPEGEGFIRLNIACPRALLNEGINRLTAVIGRCGD